MNKKEFAEKEIEKIEDELGNLMFKLTDRENRKMVLEQIVVEITNEMINLDKMINILCQDKNRFIALAKGE